MSDGAARFRLHAFVRGRVQGVWFRDFTVREARRLGVVGTVANLMDGKSVEVWAEGERTALDALAVALRRGPPAAHVEDLTLTWHPPEGRWTDFRIARP